MSIIRSIDETVEALPSPVLAAGRAWFPRCRDDLLKAALAYGLPGVGQSHVAGIFAALSPRNQWQRNWDGMLDVLRAARRGDPCPATGLLDARNKAWAIAHGELPENILRGPKVTRFWRNLSGDDEPVTVDIWMARAAGLSGNEAPTKWQYRAIEGAVQMAAGTLDIPPCGLQAAIWMHVRPARPADPWAVSNAPA